MSTKVSCQHAVKPMMNAMPRPPYVSAEGRRQRQQRRGCSGKGTEAAAARLTEVGRDALAQGAAEQRGVRREAAGQSPRRVLGVVEVGNGLAEELAEDRDAEAAREALP